MPFTNEDYLPSYEELTVPELEITSAVFRAAAHHMGKYCDKVSKEYMLCEYEENDPRKCLNEGKEVTRCGFEFLGQLKKTCYAEFTQHMNCIDHGGLRMDFHYCKKSQAIFDKCVKENLGQERPERGYFSKVRLHDTCRPRPKLKPHILPERVPDPPPMTDNPPKADAWKGPNQL